jgi:hypothetical protein
MTKLPKRDFLKTAVGGLLLAPFLRSRMLEAAGNQPKRIILFNGAGSFVPEYFPTGQGANFTFQAPLRPLASLQKDIIMMRELHHTATRGNHHEVGMVTAYSGANPGPNNGLGLQPTIDQLIARELAKTNTTPITSLAHGLYTEFNNPQRSYMTYNGPNQAIIPERNPNRTYTRLFQGVTAGTSTAGTSRDAARVKAFDIATTDLKEIQRYLGAEEKNKLDFHITSLQDLSRELGATAPPVSASCPKIEVDPNYANTLRVEKELERGIKTLTMLTTAALQCDRTRVVSIQVGFSGDHYVGLRGFNKGNRSWHDEIHHKAANINHPDHGEWVWMTNLWARHLAELANSLKAIPEGNSNMLDNTLILWGSEMGIGHSHSPRDVPYMLIGGRNMGFNSGQYLRFARSEPHAKLLTSIQHAFDMPVRGTGNLPDCGPLTGVLV